MPIKNINLKVFIHYKHMQKNLHSKVQLSVVFIFDILKYKPILSHCSLRDYSIFLFTRLFRFALYETSTASLLFISTTVVVNTSNLETVHGADSDAWKELGGFNWTFYRKSGRCTIILLLNLFHTSFIRTMKKREQEIRIPIFKALNKSKKGMAN